MMVDWQPKVLASVESTQAMVQQAAQDGEPEGYVLQAFQQTGGKGRSGNQWHSPMGNLYMSFLLRPECDLHKAGELAFVVGVGVSNAFDEYIDSKSSKKQLKWPNDILVNGLKISGILLEGGADNSFIVGVGANILNAPDLAISLNSAATQPVYVNKVRDNILDKVGIIYEEWQSNGFSTIRDLWLEQAYGLNEAMTARLPNKKVKGIFKGIDQVGALQLELANGELKTIHAADVHFDRT